MAKLTAADLPSASIAPACKHHRPLKKRKKLDTADIGTPAYNLLLQLLKCQVKHPNISGAGGDAKKCAKAEKAYSACHAAVMGVGSYNGRKHCGEEMESLFALLDVSSANESSDEGRTLTDAAILGETLDIDRRGGTYSWSSARRTAKEDVRSTQPPSNPTSATKDPYACIAFDGCGPIVLHQQPGAFLAPNAPDDGASSNESAARRRRSGRTGVALWSAAHVLSHYIDAQWSKGGSWCGDESGTSSNPRWTVLELGAGLGLCSAVAARHGMDVVATDNDLEVLALLAENLERNRIRGNNPVSRSVDCKTDRTDGGDQQIHVHLLDWVAAASDSWAEASHAVSNSSDSIPRKQTFVFRQLEALGGADLILLSDVIYGATWPAWEALLALLNKFRAQRQRLAEPLDEDGPSFRRGEPLVLLSYTQRRRDMSPQDEAHLFAMVKAARMEAILIPAENIPHGEKYVLTSLFELRWI